MKTMNTLIKNVETMTEDTLYNVIECTHVDFNKLTRKEKQSFLALNEVKKAIDGKKYTLVFDCDFETSKFHNKADESENQYLVDYACVVSNTDINTRLLQIYATSIGDTTYFRICTTCKKALREANFLESFGFKTRYDKKTGRAKTTERKNIEYDTLVLAIKNVLATLEK